MKTNHAIAGHPRVVPPRAVGDQLRRLQVDGTTLAYADRGSPRAEVIVLLHGYLGSHLSWRHHIEPLSARYRVLALDWFGWGESGRSLDLRYDYDSEVDRLRRVLDALEVASCNIFAHDYGGFLALGFCQRHPQRVRRLALLNSRAHRSFNLRWATIFGIGCVAARRPVLRSVVAKQPLMAMHRRAVRRELSAGVFDEQSFAYSAGWMSEPDGARFYVRFFSDYRVEPRAELGRCLAGMRCPTAIIWSRENPYLQARIPMELATQIPGAELTRIDAGHFIMEERPHEVQRALDALLARPTV